MGAPQPVSVRILEPLNERRGLISFTTYRILTLCPSGHPNEGLHEARRRYSDFDMLLNTLMERYPGMVVPPLPGKAGVFGGWSSSFAGHRLRGLTLFAERVARIPTLLMDSLSAAFFGLPDADEWEAALRRAYATRFDRNHNPGQLRWKHLLDRVGLPEDAQEIERLAAAAMRELRLVSAALLNLERALEAAVISAVAHAEAASSLATATTEWARLEDAEVHALNALPAGAQSAGGASSTAADERSGGCAGSASGVSRTYRPGDHTSHAGLLRSFACFAELEGQMHAAQPGMLETLFLEAVRFERQTIAEALRVATCATGSHPAELRLPHCPTALYLLTHIFGSRPATTTGTEGQSPPPTSRPRTPCARPSASLAHAT